MKKLIIACFVFFGFALVSCLDTEETITLNKDNSGLYQLTIDMGSMIEQLKTLKPDEANSMEGNKDTVILFKSFTDTATVLTAEEKKLLENGSMHIAANMDSNQMKMAMEVPFKNIEQLLYLKQHMFEMINKLKPEENLLGKNKDNADDNDNADMMQGMGNGPDPGNLLNPAQQAFTFNIEKNVISNKLMNKEVFDNWVAKDSSMKMVMQMIPFMGDFNYKTTFVLPSPVKKYSGGSESMLSNDKKTVTFINTLSGLMDKPESFEYTVEY